MTGTPSALRQPYELRSGPSISSNSRLYRAETPQTEQLPLAWFHGRRQHPHPSARLHPAATHQLAVLPPTQPQIQLPWLLIRSLLTPALPHPVADRGPSWIMFAAHHIVLMMTHPSHAQAAVPALRRPRRTANPEPCIQRSITYPATRAGTTV